MANLRAVYDDELLTLLESLGIRAALEKGKIKCRFCDDIVTIDNLHAVFPESGQIKVICSKPSCLKELASIDDR